MESNGSVLTSTVFLDRVGEVILRFDPDGLSWEPIESKELSTSCLDFKFNSVTEKEVKFSDIYAAEDTSYGLINRPTKNYGRLLSEGHFEMHRFVVHGFRRSRSRQSLWTLAAYTFGHKDLPTCQMWVDLINSYICKDVERPRSLLVFVHPLSGRRTGRKTWEDVRPIFSRSKVKTKVVVTERAGHAYDYMKSITNSELNSFDGILAVGGDGFFNEVLNGLLSSRHKAPCPPALEEIVVLVENDKNASINNSSSVQEYVNDVKSELPGNEKEPLLTDSEYIAPSFTDTDSITDAGEDSPFLFPNNWLRLGLIPAGSTDTIVLSTTGARDPITSALHVVLGKRIRLDIARVISWKGEKQSRYAHSVRYAASFAGYGFYGDVITESEKYRWMGPKRYGYAGTKVFLRHRSYEADVAYLECITPSINSGRVSEDTCIHPKESSRNLSEKVCRVNCVTCNQSDTCDTLAVIQDTSTGIPPRNSRWVYSQGRFQSVGAAIISCRNERAPDGLVADAHLADGFMHLILIKECPRPLYLWHLIQLRKNGSDPLNFEFVEHHKTQAFTFKTYTDESVWNLDGEILQARHLSAQVFRGLVTLFAAGPEF